MVTDTATEPVVGDIAPEPVITPDTGDAGSPPADAGAAPTTPSIDADAAFEEYRAAAKEGDEGKTPEPVRTRAAIDPAAVRAAIQQFRANHDTRQKALDGLEAELVEAGMLEPLAKRFVKDAKDALNAHHADSLKYAGAEAAAQVLDQEHADMWDGIQQNLEAPQFKAFQERISTLYKESDGKGVPYDTFFKEYGELQFKAGSEAGLKKGFTDGVKWRESKERVAQSGQHVNGETAPPSNAAAEDAILLDPNSPMETVNKILARRSGQ